MERTYLASIEFSLQWESSYAIHRDRHFVDKVHFWRDIFPENLGKHLGLLQPGEVTKKIMSLEYWCILLISSG